MAGNQENQDIWWAWQVDSMTLARQGIIPRYRQPAPQQSPVPFHRSGKKIDVLRVQSALRADHDGNPGSLPLTCGFFLLLGLLLTCRFPNGCLFFGDQYYYLLTNLLAKTSAKVAPKLAVPYVQGCAVAKPRTPTLTVLNLHKIKHLSRHKRLIHHYSTRRR